MTGWDDAVPMVPRRHAGLPRYLDQASFVRLLASLNKTSPRGLRDRAIILCIARLGLRASEVVELELDDVDRRNGTMRVRRRKTGHGALLPLPQQVGAALTDDLRHGPPGYSIAAGVRAAPAAGRGANQHPYRGPRGGARAGPGRDRRPGTRLIGHYSDLRLGRRAAAGRVALAGDFRTGHVVELVEDYLTLRHDLGYHSPGQDSYLRCFAAWLDRAGHRGPSRSRRRSAGRPRPVHRIRAIRPAGWPQCAGSCGTWPESTRRPRCRQLGFSARSGNASHRTFARMPRSPTCCGPRVARLGSGRVELASDPHRSTAG